MVFCHGNKVTAEEHYGVPMIIASHGYAVFSLTFMDGTAPYATGKDGEDIFFKEEELQPMHKDGSVNYDYWRWTGNTIFV